MSNLRLPQHISARENAALIATVMGAPAARPAQNFPFVGASRLTVGQRREWHRLVVDEGMDVNRALLIVRGLL